MYCNHYDNWCEEEKRTCNNCYYERGDNMNDEERKAIAEVKDAIEYDKEHRIVTMYDKQPLFRDTLQTLLNLIEKQQKEIEDLKDIQQQICNEELFEKDYIISLSYKVERKD